MVKKLLKTFAVVLVCLVTYNISLELLSINFTIANIGGLLLLAVVIPYFIYSVYRKSFTKLFKKEV